MADDLFLNLAYVALLLSTVTRTVRTLRYLLILGAAFFIAFGFVAGIASMVVWNLLIGGMHAYRVVRDIQAERSVALSADERAIRDLVLSDVSDFDFHMLWSMGREVSYSHETIIAAGTRPDTVALILDGAVHIVGAGPDKTLDRGALLGEMSYVSDQEAQVDVVAADDVTLREWEQRDLDSLSRTHPPSAKAFERLIARDLVSKTRP